MSKMNDLPIPDVAALVRFGKLGMELFAVRLLSLTALVGFLSLCVYVAFNASWQGAAVTLVALFGLRAAIAAEAPHRAPPEVQRHEA